MLHKITPALLFAFCLGLASPGPARSGDVSRREALPVFENAAEAMLGQMFMFGFRGAGPDDQDQAAEYRAMLDFVRDGKAGGVILFYTDYATKKPGRNITGPGQLRRLNAGLQAAAASSPAAEILRGENLPLLIGVDQEGGRVRRLFPAQGFMDLPAPADLGQMRQEAVYGYGRRLGEELKSLGINLNFAPSLDVNLNPRNPVIGALGRSFGRGAEQVTRQAGAFGRGLTDAGVAACLKHFPGHGSSSGDTHLAFTDVSKTWRREELHPYRVFLHGKASPKESSYLVMPGHLFNAAFDERYPASLSAKTITGLLRGELGWGGRGGERRLADESRQRSLRPGRNHPAVRERRRGYPAFRQQPGV